MNLKQCVCVRACVSVCARVSDTSIYADVTGIFAFKLSTITQPPFL